MYYSHWYSTFSRGKFCSRRKAFPLIYHHRILRSLLAPSSFHLIIFSSKKKRNRRDFFIFLLYFCNKQFKQARRGRKKRKVSFSCYVSFPVEPEVKLKWFKHKLQGILQLRMRRIFIKTWNFTLNTISYDKTCVSIVLLCFFVVVFLLESVETWNKHLNSSWSNQLSVGLNGKMRDKIQKRSELMIVVTFSTSLFISSASALTLCRL